MSATMVRVHMSTCLSHYLGTSLLVNLCSFYFYAFVPSPPPLLGSLWPFLFIYFRYLGPPTQGASGRFYFSLDWGLPFSELVAVIHLQVHLIHLSPFKNYFMFFFSAFNNIFLSAKINMFIAPFSYLRAMLFQTSIVTFNLFQGQANSYPRTC